MRVRVDMRLPEGLVARLDAERVRLGQTRTLFVERALEKALEGGVASESRSATREGGAKDSSYSPAAPSSASSRPSANPLADRQAALNRAKGL